MIVDLRERPLIVRAWRAYRNYRRIFGVFDALLSTVHLLRLNARVRR